jgi:hypothetical protein
VEQQSGASGAAQAARTILPGEPFEPPAASQVPAPRDETQPPPPPTGAPLAPPAWNYEPMPAPEGAPLYQSAPAPYGEPQPVGGDFDALHDFASLPDAPQFGAPAATAPFEAFTPAAYPPPPAEAPVFAPAPPTAAPAPPTAAFAPAQPAPAAYPPPTFAPAPSQDALPPLPPAQEDEGLFAEPDKKAKKDRKSVDKRLLAVALVAVLAGGGYFGYTQLTKKNSSSTTVNTPVTPVAPVAPAAPKYDFPANVAGFKLQSAASSATERAAVQAELKVWNPALAKTMSFASYSAGQPAIFSFVLHPAQSQLATDYAALVKHSATPGAGHTIVDPHVAVPGAAGGQMTCGGVKSDTSSSWCVWRGSNTVGAVMVTGSTKTAITEIITRELRAYAEH